MVKIRQNVLGYSMDEALEENMHGHLGASEHDQTINLLLQQLDPDRAKLHYALYCFEEEHMGDIVTLAQSTYASKAHTTYKDILREKLTRKLGFSPNDLILFTEEIVYAKIFFQIETSPESADRRACGLPVEQLEAYKKQFFPNNSYKEKIFTLLPYAVEDLLNFRKITPTRFKKVFIPVLVNLVEIVVIGYSDLDDLKTIRGMTYYLLREIFDDLMLFIAEDILFHFSNMDRKAIEFLSHFSVNECIDAHGNRHKPNPILDESNHAWNITTIRSTMLQHKKAKQTLYDKKNGLLGIKKKVDTFKRELKEILQLISVEQRALVSLEENIANIHKTLQKLQDTDAQEVKFTENGEEKVFSRTTLMAKLFKKEDMLLSEKNKLRKTLDELTMRFSNKQKEIDIWDKKYTESKELLVSMEAKGHPIDKQYERIKRALAKTLASR